MYIAFIVILWVLNRNGMTVPTSAWVAISVVTAWKWMNALSVKIKSMKLKSEIDDLMREYEKKERRHDKSGD